ISIILGFIGARLLFIFLEPNLFQNPIEIIRIWDGGLASYGGLILAVFGSVIYAKKNKLDVLKYADLFVIPIALAFAVARLGCVLVNDHLGKLTNLPWGITVEGVTRHPISAYYSISLFVLVAILILFRKNFLKAKGRSTFFALTFYSLLNFIIDNFKDFEDKTFNYYANQIFLLLIFIISFYFLIREILIKKNIKKL
ncbi:MAG: phosphatidylglycerol:prolipoprotein diacylglycerol transferase, partial [Candidatus Berkelbacteria bacterium Licking1014_96]